MKEHDLNLNDFNLDEIESIEFIGEDNTIDISVDDTHMFYANDIYTHNSSLKAAVVEGDQMGGSIKKGQIGHFIVSIAKTLDQKESSTATMAILKSRFGKDGVIFENVTFNNATIQIDMGTNTNPKTRGEYNKTKDKTDTNYVANLLNALNERKRLMENNNITNNNEN